MFTKLLLGLDGSPGSFQALNAAIVLAGKFGGSLVALSVIEREPRYAATVGEVMEEDAEAVAAIRQIQERARQIAAEHCVTLETALTHGHAAHVLTEEARTGDYDLIVLGHSGHSRVWGSFIGTTAEKVSRHVPCSVLIVR